MTLMSSACFTKLGHRLSVFNRIYHILDEKSLTAYFNGLVLPHLEYADVVWGVQFAIIPKSHCKEDFKGENDIN